MFRALKKHRLILVTGLHRSGTKIAAAMIAEDTGHDLVLEHEFADVSVEAFEAFMDADYGPKVIQCPFMLCRIHYYPEAFVVFVRRPLDEIHASISRLAVMPAWVAKEARAYHTDRDDIFELKLENWELQKQRLPKHEEINYDSLRQHPLWVDKKDRVHRDYRSIEWPSSNAQT